MHRLFFFVYFLKLLTKSDSIAHEHVEDYILVYTTQATLFFSCVVLLHKMLLQCSLSIALLISSWKKVRKIHVCLQTAIH